MRVVKPGHEKEARSVAQRGIPKSAEHRRKIAEAQKRAWARRKAATA